MRIVQHDPYGGLHDPSAKSRFLHANDRHGILAMVAAIYRHCYEDREVTVTSICVRKRAKVARGNPST